MLGMRLYLSELIKQKVADIQSPWAPINPWSSEGDAGATFGATVCLNLPGNTTDHLRESGMDVYSSRQMGLSLLSFYIITGTGIKSQNDISTSVCCLGTAQKTLT